MPQDFDFRINGENVPVTSGRLIRTMDTASDGFAVSIVVNRETQPLLYDAIKPYRYTPVTIFLDGDLSLTGNITKSSRSKIKSSIDTDISGFSRTFNFIDSNLAKRYEYNSYNLHEMAEDVAKQTATQVVFETDPGGTFNREVAERGESGFDFLRPLAQKRSQVMSCTPEGDLLFNVANTEGQTVGIIEEGNPDSLLQEEFVVSFDGRKRFKTYKVVSQSPFGPSQAVSSDDNINQPRHKVVNSNNIAGSAEEIANFQKNLSIIDALTIPIPVIGWKAPDGSTWAPNTLITLKSETMFIPDGFTFLIRQVEYISEKDVKTAILSIIPPNAYTKNQVVEPWFQ